MFGPNESRVKEMASMSKLPLFHLPKLFLSDELKNLFGIKDFHISFLVSFDLNDIFSNKAEWLVFFKLR